MTHARLKTLKLRHLLAMAVPVCLGRLGIAYDGSVNETSDKAWTKAARNHVLLLERDYELRPDQAIFQSLQVNPTHAMPDSAQDTLTGLVNFYFTPAVKALRGEK